MKTEDLWQVIRPYVPPQARPVIRLLYRRYMQVLCWYVGLWDRWHIKKTGFERLPSASLRYRVHGSPYIDGFLKVGKQCREDIEAALMKVGRDLGSFQNVLDFGCGCGRSLIWFANQPSPCRFYGTDVDADAIAWCRNNLDFAAFNVNNPLPGLDYPSEMFDLICGITVFTQLNEAFQLRWLEELKRVAKPQGIVLITVCGEYYSKRLSDEEIARVKKEGFLFKVTDYMKGIFPEWYQSAYHTQDYIYENYTAYFDILDYIPEGLDHSQDMIVLKKA